MQTSVLKKLNSARSKFHSTEIKKTGHNKFAGYHYFELGDFLVPALKIFNDVGLCAVVSFDSDFAKMTITDIDDGSQCIITSPMSSAALKGCHEVQNLGAVQTYLRRYLWVSALEIVEHDAVDSSENKPVDDYVEICRVHEEAISTIKIGIHKGDYTSAADAWASLSEEDKMAIWKAPSKGGCFTTEERAIMKTPEFRESTTK
jgi:hypothetical protein